MYAWSAAVFFGAVLLDVVYASVLREAGGGFAQSVFGEVSDFLLLLGAPTFLSALAASVLSWNVPTVRNLFLASMLILSLEFVVPIVLFPALRTSSASPLPNVMPYVRLLPLALASILALGGFRKLPR